MTDKALPIGLPSFNENAGAGIIMANAALDSLDNTPPVVAVTSPPNNGAVSLLTSISGTASDIGSGLAGNLIHLTLNYNGNFWSGTYWTNTSASDPSILLTANVVGGVWAFTNVPTGGNQMQGTYYVSAFATDNANNVSDAQPGVNNTSFIISTTPPSVAITFPPNGNTLTNQPGGNWFQGTASANFGLALNVELFIYRDSDGLYWTGSGWGNVTNGLISNTYNTNTHAWQSTGALPVPGSTLANGTYQFFAIAIDAAGNHQQANSLVTVDFHPVYVFNYGSQFGMNPNMNWSDPANWDVGRVPTPDAHVIINAYSPDNTSLGNVQIYRLDLGGGSLTTSEMLISNLYVSGGTLFGGDVTVPAGGTFNWSGGTLTGNYQIASNVTASISGPADRNFDTATLVNNSTVAWSGGRILASVQSAITNNGSFIITGPTTLDNDGLGYGGPLPLPVFVNNGLLQRTNDGGATTLAATLGGWIFYQNGTIDVGSGMLDSQNQLIVAPGTIFAGTGETRISAGTISSAGANTVRSGATVEFAGGTWTGTNSLAGGGTFVWSGGTLSGALTLQTNITLNISGASDKTLGPKEAAPTIVSRGPATWAGTGNIKCSYASVFENDGTFTVQNDSGYLNNSDGYGESLTLVPLFVNQGTFRKSTATGTTTFDANYGGTTFSNLGVLDLQSGTVVFNGNFSTTPSSTLKISLSGTNAGTQFGVESFANPATFTGTLAVSLVNGFVPTNGQSFAIANYPSSSGQFSITQLPPLPPVSHWQVSYNSSALLLLVVPGNAFQSTALANGNFGFVFIGQSGSRCLIEASTNLLDWSPLLTNAPFNGTLNYTDAMTAQFPQRFYRGTIFP